MTARCQANELPAWHCDEQLWPQASCLPRPVEHWNIASWIQRTARPLLYALPYVGMPLTLKPASKDLFLSQSIQQLLRMSTRWLMQTTPPHPSASLALGWNFHHVQDHPSLSLSYLQEVQQKPRRIHRSAARSPTLTAPLRCLLPWTSAEKFSKLPWGDDPTLNLRCTTVSTLYSGIPVVNIRNLVLPFDQSCHDSNWMQAPAGLSPHAVTVPSFFKAAKASEEADSLWTSCNDIEGRAPQLTTEPLRSRAAKASAQAQIWQMLFSWLWTCRQGNCRNRLQPVPSPSSLLLLSLSANILHGAQCSS